MALPAVATTGPRAPRVHASALSVIARVAWADVLERTRRASFLVSLLVMAALANGMLPPQGAGYRTFVINDAFRPEYNSAWVGTLVALLTGLYFLMVGFYVVKGSVEHDRRTGVGQILAAARVGRVHYVAAKMLANLLVLGAMMLAAAAMAGVTQQLLGESRAFDPVDLLTPFLWITLPVAALTAACAVLWECTPGLRGGFGNVAWFFFFVFLLSFSAIDDGSRSPYADFAGGRIIAQSIQPDMQAAFPEAAKHSRSLSMGVNVSERWRRQHLRTFSWSGLRLTPERAGSRALWLLLALGVTLLAAVPFDRFQSAARPAWLPRWRFTPFAPAVSAPAGIAHASDLAPARRTFRFDALLAAELRLLVKSQPAWCWLALAGLLVAQLFAPMAAVRGWLMPIAALMPLFAWSALGARERRAGTAALLFATARPRARLLVASFAAAALLFVVTGLPGLARLAAAGDVGALAGWGAGALFVAGLALGLGEWSGHARFFEVLCLFAWYVGPLHHIAELDVTGVTTPRPPLVTLVFALLGAAGFAAAWIGRRRPVDR